jgi:SWI/SNF-related matrix-associated actin-dependent regulator 1 of chromatin subfamily A
MAHQSAYQIIFTFGKYKGSSLGYVKDVDPGYLQWMAAGNAMPVWKQAAQRVLADKSVDDLKLPRTTYAPAKGSQNTSEQAGIVIKNKNTAAVRFPYNMEIVNRIKAEIDGRKWNPDAKCWEFPVVQLPKVVNIFGGHDKIKMDTKARKKLLDEVNRRKSLDIIRAKEDTDFYVSTKLPLFPYQNICVEFVVRAGGRAMIADEPGTGKTIEAIAYAIYSKAKTLIVCPKSVTYQWAEEIEKFAGKNTTIWTTKTIEGHGNNQFHVINYDAVPKQLDKLLKKQFDLLVCDEATNLKNRRTLRAKAILGSWKERKKFPGIKTKSILFLTGTPILNRPLEAYYLLSSIDSQRFNNFYHFVRRYGGWKGDEPKNLKELHERTKDMVIRRRLKDVWDELPEKRRRDVIIRMEQDERQEYEQLLYDLFKTWKFQGKATIGTMPKIQGFLSRKKLERAKEIIDEYLGADKPIIIFSVYIDPLRELKKHYGDTAELLYGDTPAQERRDIVKRLAEGKSMVGCIGLKAGGMGLDGLQEAISTVVFLNMDWVPGVHEQAEDRAHRIGQKNKVQAIYLVCKDTIDEDMKDLLAEKQKVIDVVADGDLISAARSRSTFKEFVKRLTSKHGQDFMV